ncbi:hypothetical protein [Halarcobacter sp.]|uniref:hypothetical protein n=1 Tax=Halarcobacter sp. TaxID=2321133 RepID=UPI002AAB8114|nr:hypothetical protein [Halarcobacter sp.]
MDLAVIGLKDLITLAVLQGVTTSIILSHIRIKTKNIRIDLVSKLLRQIEKLL